jgi:hypothetical protein
MRLMAIIISDPVIKYERELERVLAGNNQFDIIEL